MLWKTPKGVKHGLIPTRELVMHPASGDSAAASAINDLYWGSDLSVNQIAEHLDLSKGALYGMIDPAPAGEPCPDCGAPLVFENRTARDRGRATCLECGGESAVEAGTDDGSASESPARARSTRAAAGGAPSPVERTSFGFPVPPPDPAPGPDPLRGRIVLGGALLGAAAGLALVLWARRR